MGKHFWKSKTIWANLLGVIQIVFGPEVLPVDTQVAILGVINFVIRLITKEPIKWS